MYGIETTINPQSPIFPRGLNGTCKLARVGNTTDINNALYLLSPQLFLFQKKTNNLPRKLLSHRDKPVELV